MDTARREPARRTDSLLGEERRRRRYALEGLPSKVLAREYRLALPDEKRLAAEIEKTRQRLEAHRLGKGQRPRRRRLPG